jgi:hypothetical protein
MPHPQQSAAEDSRADSRTAKTDAMTGLMGYKVLVCTIIKLEAAKGTHIGCEIYRETAIYMRQMSLYEV